MQHDRLQMLNALNTVKPALAAKDLIEELTHVWFDGKTVTAYNDADLGIQVPFESPFNGGLRGALLLGLLHNSRAKEVTFDKSENEGEVLFKAARARARLSVLDIDRAIHELPEPSKLTYDFDDTFIEALKLVMVSVGNDTSIPEKMGITLFISKGWFDLYTTDSKTIAHVQLQIDPKASSLKPGARYILPTVFCEQLIRLCPQGGVLDLGNNMVRADSEEVMLWARLVELSGKPLDFAGVVAKQRDMFEDAAHFPIPSRLSLALDRSLTLLDGLPDEPATFSVGDKKIRIETIADGRGELKDSADIQDADPPEDTFRIAPGMIKRAFSQASHMAANSKVLIMSNDDTGFSYYASTAAAK